MTNENQPNISLNFKSASQYTALHCKMYKIDRTNCIYQIRTKLLSTERLPCYLIGCSTHIGKTNIHGLICTSEHEKCFRNTHTNADVPHNA